MIAPRGVNTGGYKHPCPLEKGFGTTMSRSAASELVLQHRGRRGNAALVLRYHQPNFEFLIDFTEKARSEEGGVPPKFDR